MVNPPASPPWRDRERRRDDRSGQALTEDSIGFALDRLGRTAAARTAYERAAEACRALGWQVMLVSTLVRLADVCQRLGDDQGAERARSQAEEIVRITGPHALEP